MNVKKIIALAALVIAVMGLFAFSVHYKNGKINNNSDYSTVVSTTEAEAVEKTDEYSSDTPYIETDDGEYQIYFDGKIVTIVHGDYRTEIKNLDVSFKAEKPKAVSADIDNDGEKELLLRLYAISYNNDDSTRTTVYSINLYDPAVQNDEKYFLRYTAYNSTWTNPFGESVRAEVTQLKNHSKILQYNMVDINDELQYDENGVAVGNYTGFATALCDSSKNYYTLKNWSYGYGIYDINEDGTITLDIQVVAEYEETDTNQIFGYIHCNVVFSDYTFSIVPKKINFVAKEGCEVTDPRNMANDKWSVTINNLTSTSGFQSNSIDWIENEFNVADLSSSQDQYFDTMSSKIKCLDKIKFSQSGITLTAKSGYTFSSQMADNGKFSAIINNDENKDIDISYKCVIKTVDGRSTLVITFDRNYSQQELESLKIVFGL